MIADGVDACIRRALPRLAPEDAAQLTAVIRRLIDALRPARIHLFGSHARGEAAPDSDIDLLVVVPASDLLPHQRDQEAYHAISPHRLAVDILVMTHDEFEWRSRSPASLPATVLREGRVLYAAPVEQAIPRLESGTDPCIAKDPRSMQSASQREGQEWLDRADRDLLMARRGLEDPALPEATAYHAQQAAEKALKAFLTLHGRPFTKTHVLEDLIAICQRIDPAFASYLPAAKTLSPYVGRFRYPGRPLAPPLAEAQQALQSATEIVEFVRQRLPGGTTP